MVSVLEPPSGPDLLSPIALDERHGLLGVHAQRIGNVALHAAELGIVRTDVLPMKVELDGAQTFVPLDVLLPRSLDGHAVRSWGGVGGKTFVLGKLRFGLPILGCAVYGHDALEGDGAGGGINGIGRDHQSEDSGEG